MQIFVTGATGFIGTSLVERLSARGDRIVAWVRDEERARKKLGAKVELLSLDRDPSEVMGNVDAVVNLAGEPVIGRWTDAKKEAMVASRVNLTRNLVNAIGHASSRPKVLVSSSAVGFYGDAGDMTLTESAPQGQGFLAELCHDWENAARGAEAHGARVALIRTGVVLGRGGAFEKMLPVFKAGAGGKLGSGEQYMAWIHLDDLVELFVKALDDDRYRGPINGTAPSPVTNKEFTKMLADLLHRPAIMQVPSFALKLVFGEGGSVMTSGQRAIPQRAKELGFVHRYPELRAALEAILA